MTVAIMMLGCPGAGKGTQARFISEKYKLPIIAMGDILRESVAKGDELGKMAKTLMDSGQLLPDHIVIEIVKQRLSSNDCQNGFILDGFPRTIVQAQALIDANVALSAVINIVVPEQEIVERMAGRMVEPVSGRIYNLKVSPPKVAGIDDVNGLPLEHRVDDDQQTVLKRLGVYNKQTKPLIEFYQTMSVSDPKTSKVLVIDGVGTLDEIQSRISHELAGVIDEYH